MELEVDVVLASALEVSWEMRDVRMAARALCRYVMVVKRITRIQERNVCSTKHSQANQYKGECCNCCWWRIGVHSPDL
jgi:hypothetical protein